jgi:hypothetical protein
MLNLVRESRLSMNLAVCATGPLETSSRFFDGARRMHYRSVPLRSHGHIYYVISLFKSQLHRRIYWGGSAHSRAAPHSDAAEFAAVPFGRTAVQLAVDEQSLTLLDFVL